MAKALIVALSALFMAVPAGARQIQFSKNFKFCVATAAYQIEGDNVNSDLYRWESEAPDRVVTRMTVPGAPHGPFLNPKFGATQDSCPVVDASLAATLDPLGLHSKKFSRPDGRVSVCEFSGQSIDHWNRVAEDVALIRRLGVDQYRFSVEWSRIEPSEGSFDESALNHYVNEVALLKANGIEPLVTLFHFSLPQWFRDRGGWENPHAAILFARFTAKVYAALGADVKTWFTLNEPMIHLAAGYAVGVLPPGKFSDSTEFLERPMVGLLAAHAAAYHTLHDLAVAAGREVRVGVAHHLRVIDPIALQLVPLSPDLFLARSVDTVWNWMVVDAIETGVIAIEYPGVSKILKRLPELKGTQDFFGVNYYTRDRLHWNPFITQKLANNVNPKAIASGQINDMGWEIYPEGFYRILKSIDRRLRSVGHRHLPIFVSENGIADDADSRRQAYIESHLSAMSDAMNGHQYGRDEPSGDPPVEVEGYCYWTLADNFEWNSGYYPHFGFYSVNLSTQVRTLRPSGDWFSRMIQARGFQTH